MTFRVVSGTARVHGQEYNEGDEVESDSDLVTAFPGKFELVDGEEQDPDATDEGQIGDETKKGGTRVKDTRSTKKSFPTRATAPQRTAVSSKSKRSASASSKKSSDDDDDDE